MVRLKPMNKIDFRAYLDFAAEDLAQQYVRAGNWHPSEAAGRATALLQQMLPDGLATENQHLFSVVDEQSGAKVGLIWLMVRHPGPHASLFICDFWIFEPFRRRGFGTQTLRAVEDKARALGIDRISLHVFAHNHAARALYERAGYGATGLHMAKNLGGQDGRLG